MEALKKLMEKKADKEGLMSPEKQKAKMELLEELRDMAKSMMMDDLKGHMDGMKKVTVASDSKEGLNKGLEKAEEVLGEDLDNDNELGEPDDHIAKVLGKKASEYPNDEEEMSESPEEEAGEFDNMSKEELLAHLKSLKAKK